MNWFARFVSNEYHNLQKKERDLYSWYSDHFLILFCYPFSEAWKTKTNESFIQWISYYDRLFVQYYTERVNATIKKASNDLMVVIANVNRSKISEDKLMNSPLLENSGLFQINNGYAIPICQAATYALVLKLLTKKDKI
jgi:hypothetical protein